MIIMITGADGAVKAKAEGSSGVRLIYAARYEEGDTIHLISDPPVFVETQLEDSLPATFGYLKGEFLLPVPFGEKRVSYSPKCFTGDVHLLWACAAEPWKLSIYRNMALNPLDNHYNTALFPHASANVETRGESVFAARNAINGNITSAGHGPWPYESWGINRRDDAEMRVEFGRPIRLDRLVFTLRSDFPHDNWWTRSVIRFSDGSEFIPNFIKTGEPQSFDIEPRIVESLTMGGLTKDETDPSPFPALIQLECWGCENS